MKFLIFALAVAVAHARPDVSHISGEANAPILKSEFDITPESSFRYAYETGNGIASEAQGGLKSQGSEYPSLEITGYARYTSPEGQPIELTYVANENGYQPQGSHLPTPPPIPEAIVRSLAYISAHQPPVGPGAFQGF